MNCVGKIIVAVALIPFTVSAADGTFAELDNVLADRSVYMAGKEHRIDSLKALLVPSAPWHVMMDTYDRLYDEYLAYCFDSAMVYVDRAEALLADSSDTDMISRVRIHRALTLATSGHFSQAVDLLRTVDSQILSADIRKELYYAYEWTYGVWAEYSNDRTFAPEYNRLSVVYLDSLIAETDTGTPAYAYHCGDKAIREGDYTGARDLYLSALDSMSINTRMYAQAAYGLAMAYKELGDKAKYREWLVNASISDQVTPLKENLALQQLALDIKNEGGDLATANRYLKYSLEDALFYNNRLRLLEISEKFPEIVIAYQDMVSGQNRRLMLYVGVIGLLAVGLVVAIGFIVKQKHKVTNSRHELAELNAELTSLNRRLAQTNASREQYVSLFMDLCAAYIDKLKRFQSAVSLKVKARQFDDLPRIISNSARPSDAELRELFFNFDTAFLRLYPDFIERFNSLLQTDKSIYPRKGELLNTDLRIFALIRMGITDSNKIATLLFYSPQTIFNRRTQVRNRALNRNSFETQVMDICSVLPFSSE